MAAECTTMRRLSVTNVRQKPSVGRAAASKVREPGSSDWYSVLINSSSWCSERCACAMLLRCTQK